MKINLGLLSLLTIVLVVLKLIGIITCSWWLVLLPTIICLVIAVLFVFYLLSLANRLAKKVKAEIDNQDKDTEYLFKGIEKNLIRKDR